MIWHQETSERTVKVAYIISLFLLSTSEALFLPALVPIGGESKRPDPKLARTSESRRPPLRGGRRMDPWAMFAEMCNQVVTEQNVYLDILITRNGIEMMLMPLDDTEEEEGDE